MVENLEYVDVNVASPIIVEGEPYIPADGGDIKITVSGTPGHTFSIDLEDADECSILSSPLKDIKMPQTGIYTFTQKFPAYKSGKGVYTFKNGEIVMGDAIYQYPNPTITFTRTSDSTASTNPQTLTLAGDDVTATGKIFGTVSGIPTTTRTWNDTSKKWYDKITTAPGTKDVSWTATKAGDYDGNLFLSRQPNSSDISTSTSYTRTVDKKVSKNKEIKLSTGTTSIVKGMSGEITSTFTKTIVKSIGITTCDEATSEFELNNVKNLLPLMIITGEGIGGVEILSINYTERIITISVPLNIKDNTELTFRYPSAFFSVEDIKDHHAILSEEVLNIHKGATIVFDDNPSKIETLLVATGSGSGTITISGTFFVENFGNKDVTYSLNVDNFITNTPNAYNQDVYVTKDTATAINMIAFDTDSNATGKVGTVVSGPSHGSVGAYDTGADTITYTPHTGFTGEDKFTYTMTDSGADAISAEKTIYITVT